MYMFVYVLYTQAAVEGGEGGGSVQLLTGGRRVSQASPTLSQQFWNRRLSSPR